MRIGPQRTDVFTTNHPLDDSLLRLVDEVALPQLVAGTANDNVLIACGQFHGCTKMSLARLDIT